MLWSGSREMSPSLAIHRASRWSSPGHPWLTPLCRAEHYGCVACCACRLVDLDDFEGHSTADRG